MGFLTTIAPFAAPAASAFGGLLGARGQAEANATNIALARENRTWQKMMSDTANQRAAKDLEAAGLNRILALGRPASTPTGNVAQVGNVGKAFAESAGTLGSTAAQLGRMEADLNAIQKRADLTEKQTMALGAIAEIGEFGGEFLGWVKDQLKDKSLDDVIKMLKDGAMSLFGIDPNQPTVSSLLDSLRDDWYRAKEVKVKPKKRRPLKYENPTPEEYTRKAKPGQFRWPSIEDPFQ